MKSLLLYAFLAGVAVMGHAQPAGREYVIQTDFGDAQDSIYPQSTGQWIFSPWWKDVQPLGTQTDWYGPHYQPLGASSHGKYVMIDDDPFDYGAIAGNLHDLEYRLVACDFDFHVYDPSATNSFVDGGTLYVLLTNSDLDVRVFDADDPAAFEADGHGQVLFTFEIPGGIEGAITDPWGRLSALNPNTSAYRTAYALGKSSTGTPGSPFTYVGLVWRSRDPFAERILIDNFSLRDVCPDCPLPPSGYPLKGCFEHTWSGPIGGNYYYYTAEIRDSATNGVIFQALHKPARFIWDGVGNQGAWLGVEVPLGTAMKANVTYYSCLRGTSNVLPNQYELKRISGCVDVPFGGNKLVLEEFHLDVAPSPVASEDIISIKYGGAIAQDASLAISDLAGHVLYATPANVGALAGRGQELRIPRLAKGLYLLRLSSRGNSSSKLILVLSSI